MTGIRTCDKKLLQSATAISDNYYEVRRNKKLVLKLVFRATLSDHQFKFPAERHVLQQCWCNKLSTKHLTIFQSTPHTSPANNLLVQKRHVSTKFREFINFQLNRKTLVTVHKFTYWYKSKISLANGFP